MKKKREFNCTIEASMCFIGGKYKPIILWHLIDGEKRFSELQRLMLSRPPRRTFTLMSSKTPTSRTPIFWQTYSSKKRDF